MPPRKPTQACSKGCGCSRPDGSERTTRCRPRQPQRAQHVRPVAGRGTSHPPRHVNEKSQCIPCNPFTLTNVRSTYIYIGALWRRPRTYIPYRSSPRFWGFRGYTEPRPPPFRRIPPLYDAKPVYTPGTDGDTQCPKQATSTPNKVTHYTGRKGRCEHQHKQEAAATTNHPHTHTPSNTPTADQPQRQKTGSTTRVFEYTGTKSTDPTRLRPTHPTNKRYYQNKRNPPTHQTPTPQNTTTPNPPPPPPRTRGIPHPAPYHSRYAMGHLRQTPTTPNQLDQTQTTHPQPSQPQVPGLPHPTNPTPRRGRTVDPTRRRTLAHTSLRRPRDRRRPHHPRSRRRNQRASQPPPPVPPLPRRRHLRIQHSTPHRPTCCPHAAPRTSSRQ